MHVNNLVITLLLFPHEHVNGRLKESENKKIAKEENNTNENENSNTSLNNNETTKEEQNLQMANIGEKTEVVTNNPISENYNVVAKINEELDSLYRDIIAEQKNHIAIANKVMRLKGLVLNLIS